MDKFNLQQIHTLQCNWTLIRIMNAMFWATVWCLIYRYFSVFRTSIQYFCRLIIIVEIIYIFAKKGECVWCGTWNRKVSGMLLWWDSRRQLNPLFKMAIVSSRDVYWNNVHNLKRLAHFDSQHSSSLDWMAFIR